MKYNFSAAVGTHFEIEKGQIEASGEQEARELIREKYKGKQLVIKEIKKSK